MNVKTETKCDNNMHESMVMHQFNDMIVKKEKKKREPGKLVIINEEELIQQVEIRPILYDKYLKSYRKSALRDQSWKEVASCLGSTVEECRKRWRSLRDAFSKHYKLFDGDMYPKKKKWLFYDQMYFIAPYLDCANRTLQENNTLSIQENSHEAIMELEDRINMEEVEETTFKDTQEIQEHETQVVTEQNQEQAAAIMDLNDENQFVTRIFTSSSDNYQEDNLKKHNTDQLKLNQLNLIDSTDFDERFLLSCLPILKRLSDKKNALARLRIQQILYSIEFEEQ